ncbi:hypothetical protein [Pasteurella multocida]
MKIGKLEYALKFIGVCHFGFIDSCLAFLPCPSYKAYGHHNT